MEMNITEHVVSAQRGNQQAFEKIFESTKSSVYYTCLGLMKNEADAKDLMQETYLASFRKIRSLAEPEKYPAWVHRIAVNKCKDALVARKEWIISSDEAEDIPDTNLESLPESYIIQKDMRNVMLQIMRDRLSDVQYRTILLFYFDELTIAEISILMSCSENTIKSRLHLAKAKLKEGISMYEEDNKDTLYVAIPFLARFFRADASETLVPTVTANFHKNAGESATQGARVHGFRAGTSIKWMAVVLCAVLGIAAVAVCILIARSRDQDKPSTTRQTVNHDEASPDNNEETQRGLDSQATSEDREGEDSDVLPETGNYENDVLELCYDPEDVDFSIMDIAQTGSGLTVLTSDHVVAAITDYDGTLNNAQQVAENAVGIMDTDQYLVKCEAGTYSLYPIPYGNGDSVESADAVIREGMEIPNICYANISSLNTPMILSLDDTTLKYTDCDEVQDVPLYIYKEDQDVAFYSVRDIYYGDSSFFVLLENNEVYDLRYCALGGFSIAQMQSPEPGATQEEQVYALSVFYNPRITDVARIFATGTLNWWGGEVIYEKVGDSENIYAYNFLSEDDCFSTQLPDGYTTADIAHVEVGDTGMIVEFADGHIYLMDADDLSQLTYCEELTDLNSRGSILAFLGGKELYFLMEDHQLYEVCF